MQVTESDGVRVSLNLDSIAKAIDEMANTSPTLRDIQNKWAFTYRKYLFAHFNTNGRGSWPPLAPSTKRVVSRGRARLLRDSGTLREAVRPTAGESSAPGSLTTRLPHGIRIGYGGGARHPIATHLTIQRLALIHHQGMGRVPVRKIMVVPDKETLDKMERDAVRAFNKMKRRKGMK
jgi:hypothetical protein